MLVVADAARCVCSLRTAVKITLIPARSTVSDMLAGLPTSRDVQQRMQLAPSAVVQAAQLMRLQPKKWGSDPSAGPKQGGHGTAYFFRQPRKGWWTKMNGQSPIQRAGEPPRRGQHEEEYSFRERSA